MTQSGFLPWRESGDLPRIGHRREPPGGDMQRRGSSGRPTKGQRKIRPKARKAPIASVTGADLKEQLDRRTRELDEALQQQTATSEVLSIIRRSPPNPQPGFDATVQSPARRSGPTFAVAFWY